MVNKVEISKKTIVFTVLFLIGLYLLYFLRGLILQFFVAVLIMTILDPIVGALTKFRIPRPLAVLIMYVFLIVVSALLIANLAQPLIEQSGSFVKSLPNYLESAGITTELGDHAVSDFLSQIGILPAHFAQYALSALNNIFDVIAVLIFAYYLLVSRESTINQLIGNLTPSSQAKINNLISKLELQLGSWSRGELILMTLVGTMNYLGFYLLGVPFALPLAILAGLLEIVPLVGPVIAAVPAVIIGFGISPIIGIATIALATLVQQVENYVFVPNVMQRSVGLPALVVLISLTVGLNLAGVVGAIVSIPTVLAIRVVIKELNIYPGKLV